MTDVRNDDFTLIHTLEDVIPLYRGNLKPLHQQTLGMETEICLYKNVNGKPVATSSKDCADLLQYLKDLGHQPQLEMASAVEYASPPCRVDQVASLQKEIDQSWIDYQAAIKDKGFISNDAALLPFVTVESAKENLVDRDRARGLVKGMGLLKAPEFLKVTLLCTSTQVSVSYKDADDLFKTLTTATALIPVFYGLFANHPAFIENNEKALDTNPRAKFYEAFGKDGGIPASLLNAKDGTEFIRNHAQQVFNSEMLFYYDQNKDLVWPQKPVTFADLASIGLNTRTNYDLAETFVYTDLKVCNIRDENGVATGKRVEVRCFDAGELGVKTSLPFVHAVLRDEATVARVNGLLETYGIVAGSDAWKDQVLAARHAVAEHGGKFLDVPFGNGTLKNFCRDLGKVLELYVAKNPSLGANFAPLLEICANGVTQAQAKAQATPNLQAAQNQLLQGVNDNELQAKTSVSGHFRP